MARRNDEAFEDDAAPGDLATPPGRAAGLLAALAEYRTARRRLLGLLGLTASNRDPVPELAEHLVADLLDGQIAASRVQADWDVMTPDGTVQVRTLSNTGPDRWVNEHVVRSLAGVDRYALVILEDLTVSALIHRSLCRASDLVAGPASCGSDLRRSLIDHGEAAGVPG